jgi:hypothetical protein
METEYLGSKKRGDLFSVQQKIDLDRVNVNDQSVSEQSSLEQS